MKIRYAFLFAILLGISNANAATLYVSLTSTNPVAPYASWNTAAVTIQDAIDASATNDLILVTDGVYQTGEAAINGTNRVAVTNSVTIQSVNGPAVTVIDGGNTMRCVYLTNNAVLIGFTLANGNPAYLGEGTHPAGYGGGALCANSGEVLSNCVLTGNSDPNGAGSGGIYGGTLYNCVLTNNQYGAAAACNLNNSLVVSNSGGGAVGCTLNNCTIVHNSGGGWGGVGPGYFNNCIIYYNNPNYQFNGKLVFSFNNCDTTPSPPEPVVNLITNEPLFIDPNGDFHLQSNSPCINSGNNALAIGATDLDGDPRIVGGTVDIGAYEYQTPVSMTSYAFLEQYELPISTNIDTSDLDGTSFDVYQDWIAGLDPTNPASVLAMFPPAATNNAAGITVTWQSVSGIMYFLQCSTNLPDFITIRHHICAQASTTSFTDSTATNNLPYFYRIGVTTP